mmetsp:Transcript_15876/g.17632  ORF Transcript_15876/g.17632 Transcript_15876/m.17632 type:complete len:209 (-) Transcript_15876:1555-2181(-)
MVLSVSQVLISLTSPASIKPTKPELLMCPETTIQSGPKPPKTAAAVASPNGSKFATWIRSAPSSPFTLLNLELNATIQSFSVPPEMAPAGLTADPTTEFSTRRQSIPGPPLTPSLNSENAPICLFSPRFLAVPVPSTSTQSPPDSPSIRVPKESIAVSLSPSRPPKTPSRNSAPSAAMQSLPLPKSTSPVTTLNGPIIKQSLPSSKLI